MDLLPRDYVLLLAMSWLLWVLSTRTTVYLVIEILFKALFIVATICWQSVFPIELKVRGGTNGCFLLDCDEASSDITSSIICICPNPPVVCKDIFPEAFVADSDLKFKETGDI